MFLMDSFLNPYQADLFRILNQAGGGEIGYIGYIFAFYATQMGSRDTGETKVDPHLVQDPPWSINGP